MKHILVSGSALVLLSSCRLGNPSLQKDFLLINLSLPRSATTSLAGVFGNYRSEHEYKISETIHHLLDFREKKISQKDLQKFLRDRAKTSRLQVDSASFFFLAPDVVIKTFPDAYYFFTFRSCDSWIVSMVDNSVFAHKMIREGKHTVDISFLDRYSEYFIKNHKHAVFENHTLLAAQADHIVANLANAWGESTLRVLTVLQQVEPERRLVIRLSDFSHSTERFARLVKVPPETLITHNLHLNRDRDPALYKRLLGASRLARYCAAWERQIEDWIKINAQHFPELVLP